jgi:GNAT superfamily N-acetyltransferase
MTNQFTIKQAEPQDVAIILQFIKELADYEKLLHEVVATEEILAETLFGTNPRAEVLIGYMSNQPVSFVLYFFNYSTFLGRPGIYIEDLYVKPEYRGFGIGKKLLVHLAKICKQHNYPRLQWWVLDWNQDAIKFYQKIGAKPMDEWTVFRVAGGELEQLAAAE